MGFYPNDKDDEVLLVRFLTECSPLSLDNLLIKRLDYDQQLRKEIVEKIDRAILNMAIVRLVEILRDHPELRPPVPVRPTPEGSHENVHRDSVEQRPDRMRGEQRDSDGGAPPLRVPLAERVRNRVRRQRPGRSRPGDPL